MKTDAVTNRTHKGAVLRFHSHNGKSYSASLVSVRKGIAKIKYDLTNDYGCVVGKYDAQVPVTSLSFA